MLSYERHRLSNAAGYHRVSDHLAEDAGGDPDGTPALRRREGQPGAGFAPRAPHHRHARDAGGEDQRQPESGGAAPDREQPDRTAIPVCAGAGPPEGRSAETGHRRAGHALNMPVEPAFKITVLGSGTSAGVPTI